MVVIPPRSMDAPNRVSPDAMVDPGRKVNACDELLLLHLVQVFAFCSGLVVTLHSIFGSSAFALICFNCLKRRWHLLNHNSALLNLLPNCLHSLQSCCLRRFLDLHGGGLTSAGQRLHCGASPPPMLTCPCDLLFFFLNFLSKEKF